MNRHHPGFLCHAALLVTLALWSSSFACIRIALESYSPYHLALLRFLMASLIFAMVATVKKVRIPERRDAGRVAACGILGIGIYHTALNYGQSMVSAGAASFVVSTVPIFTVLIAAVVLKESISPRKACGIALSFGGIGLIALGEHRAATRPGVGAGALFILLAAVCQAILFTIQRPLLRKYSPFETICYTMWSGIITLFVFLPGVPRQVAAASARSTLALVYLAVFPAAIANYSWTYVLGQMPASRAVTYLYACPPLSLLIAWLWLGEVPGGLSIVGCTLALGGVILVNASSRRRVPPATGE